MYAVKHGSQVLFSALPRSLPTLSIPCLVFLFIQILRVDQTTVVLSQVWFGGLVLVVIPFLWCPIAHLLGQVILHEKSSFQNSKLVLRLPMLDFRLCFGLMVITLITFFFTLVGFLALIIPGIYFLSRLSISSHIFVSERTTIFQAIRSSWSRMDGHVFEMMRLQSLLSVISFVTLFFPIFLPHFLGTSKEPLSFSANVVVGTLSLLLFILVLMLWQSSISSFASIIEGDDF